MQSKIEKETMGGKGRVETSKTEFSFLVTEKGRPITTIVRTVVDRAKTNFTMYD